MDLREKSITLYLTEGSSDKFYAMELLKQEGGWIVNGANGRRGTAPKLRSKTGVVSAEKAKSEWDKLWKDKVGKKGYTLNEDGAPGTTPVDFDVDAWLDANGAEAGPMMSVSNERRTNFSACLLTEMEDKDAQRLGDDWLAQEKHNGKRLGVIVEGKGAALFSNRTGLEIAIGRGEADDVARLSELEALNDLFDLGAATTDAPLILDAEYMGGYMVIFDIARLPGLTKEQMEATGPTQRERADMLKALSRIIDANDLGQHIKVDVPQPVSQFLAERYDDIKKNGREGWVAKRADSRYSAGRVKEWVKIVFTASCTVRVAGQYGDKRSVFMELMDEKGAWTPVGKVTVPPSYDIPAPGTLLEVEYLNANRGGALFQPRITGIRDDVGEEACTMAQLKFKNEAKEDDAEPAMSI
jgi:bifunctional non-homologous end joining protein LigD